MIIDVEQSGYSNPADVFRGAATGVGGAADRLAGRVGAGGGMAGTDTAGQAWSKEYDGAATQALQAGYDTGSGLDRIGVLLRASVVNHANAESSSNVAGTGAPSPSAPVLNTFSLCHAPVPSALGQHGDGAPEWFNQLGDYLGGVLWPNGDPGTLRAVGDAWHDAASTVRSYSGHPTDASGMLEAVKSPEIPTAMGVCSDMATQMSALADTYQQLGDSCHEYAGHIDAVHEEMVDLVADTVRDSLVIQFAGAVLIPLTAGLSEAAAQTAQGAKLAAIAARVVARIGEFVTAVERVAASVRTVLGKITGITALMAKLKNSRIVLAVTKAAEKLGAAKSGARAAEEAAAKKAAEHEAERALKAEYDAYRKRLIAKGKTPRSREAWEKMTATIKANAAKGKAYEQAKMKSLGIEHGTDGWTKQLRVMNGKRRYDFGNASRRVGVETKSGRLTKGSGSYTHAVRELDNDAEMVQRGWDVEWHLEHRPDQEFLDKLNELARKSRGRFRYHIDNP